MNADCMIDMMDEHKLTLTKEWRIKKCRVSSMHQDILKIIIKGIYKNINYGKTQLSVDINNPTINKKVI